MNEKKRNEGGKMRKLLIVTLLLVFAGAVFAATMDELLEKQIDEMKMQGLYDEALWDLALGTPTDPGLDEGGETYATAVVISTLPYTDTGYTCDNVNDYDYACPYTGSLSPDVVYSYSPAVNEVVDITLCLSGTNYDTKLYVYDSSTSDTLACNDDWCPGYVSELTGLNMIGGNTYFIVVDGYYGDCGNYEILVSYPPPPPGTNCLNPFQVTLPAAMPYVDVMQTTCGMLDDYSGTCLGSYDGGEDVLYEVNVTSPVTVDITVTSTSTYIGVCIDDNCPPDLSCIAQATGSSGPWAMTGVVLNPGTYYIMVDTWPTPTCIPAFDLTIVNAAPPPPPPDVCGWGICNWYAFANNEPDTSGVCNSQPAYNWVMVDDDTLLLGDDVVSGAIPMGFPFPFYGGTYWNFYISSNGWISLSTETYSDLSNSTIPNADGPSEMIAWFWDDLDPGDLPGLIIYENMVVDGHPSMVVTFEKFQNYPGVVTDTLTMTAQVIMKQNGNIKVQYQNFDPNFDMIGSTLGIESESNGCGVEYLYNGAPRSLYAGMVIEYGTDDYRLPVELTSFEAVGMDEAARLTWSTASETNNDHFALYRSTSEEGEYARITTVEAAGNTANETNYSFIDRNLVNGVTYYYQLEDVDINGLATMHDITVSATPGEGAMGVMVDEYKLHQNFPNPFNPNNTITYDV